MKIFEPLKGHPCNRSQGCLVLLQATVQVRNGEILLNGDVVDDDIVPLKFKPVLDDAETVVELEKEMMEPKTDTAGKNLNILLKCKRVVQFDAFQLSTNIG